MNLSASLSVLHFCSSSAVLLTRATYSVAAAGAQRVEHLVDVVEVFGEVDFLAHPALVGGVWRRAVAVERDAEVRGRLHAGQFVDDVPEAKLGRVDQPVHAAGNVEAEDEVDRLALGDRGGAAVAGSAGWAGGLSWPQTGAITTAVSAAATIHRVMRIARDIAGSSWKS